MSNDQKPIISVILIVGIAIAGAILLRGSNPPPAPSVGIPVTTSTLAPVGPEDRTLGDPNAKVTVIMYEDFQCPFCGAVFGSQSNPSLLQSLKQQDPTWSPFEPPIISDYVKAGKVQFVYRDFAFLGANAKASGQDPVDESLEAAEAARCAGDQGQFWQYHDYLFSHQNGEDQGAFSVAHLEDFAKNLGLNTANFNQCLESNKYAQAVADSRTGGAAAGVQGTPKGFILVNGKISSTIDGAESWTTVKPKIDAALQQN